MEKTKRKKVILKTLLGIFAAGMVITGGMLLYYGYGYWSDRKANDAVKEVAYDSASDADLLEDADSEDKSIDFAALSEINPEIIGWVTACAGAIDGPIVQTDNNDYYLSHLFDNTTGNAGCFFADTYSVPAFDCPFTVVYGHYKKDKSMFYSLHYYKDQDYYEENPTFTIYTENGSKVYQIFSVFYGDYEADFEDIYEYGITSDDADVDKIKNIYEQAVSKSLYDILSTSAGADITENLSQMSDADIVVLYTCEYSGVNNRMLVFGINFSN